MRYMYIYIYVHSLSSLHTRASLILHSLHAAQLFHVVLGIHGSKFMTRRTTSRRVGKGGGGVLRLVLLLFFSRFLFLFFFFRKKTLPSRN